MISNVLTFRVVGKTMKFKSYFYFSFLPNLPPCEFSRTFLPKYQLRFNSHHSTVGLVEVQVYGVLLSGGRSKGKGRNRPGLDSIFRRNIDGRNASLDKSAFQSFGSEHAPLRRNGFTSGMRERVLFNQ